MKQSSTRKRSPFALLGWVSLVVGLATMAYLAGAMLARRWMMPSLALPEATRTPLPMMDAPDITSGEPAESVLGAEAADRWQFQGQAGQSATVEMWLHPGSGSSVDAELTVRLIAPDGTVLAQETGSVFFPPYLFNPGLPSSGPYLIEVRPRSGAPGRYSLGLTLSDALPSVASGATPGPTAAPGEVAAAAPSIDFQWPTARRAISGWTFHDPRKPNHIGLDITARTLDPIVAVADGKVIFADWGGGYGNLVILEHGGDWRSYYAHLTEFGVEVGQEVRRGETLGGAGTTGNSTGPHLHFELRYKDRPVDPHIYLP